MMSFTDSTFTFTFHQGNVFPCYYDVPYDNKVKQKNTQQLPLKKPPESNPTTCSTLLCFSSNCQQILVSYTENLLALFKITPNHKYLLDSFIHINNYWRITNSLYKMHESEAWQRKITIAVPFLKSRKNGIWLCNQILLKLVILIGLYAYNHCENVRISAIRKSS